MDASTGSLLHLLLLPGISAGAPALQGEHRAARAAVNPSLQPRALPNSPFHPNLWKSRSLPATHSTIARWNRQCSPAAAGAPAAFLFLFLRLSPSAAWGQAHPCTDKAAPAQSHAETPQRDGGQNSDTQDLPQCQQNLLKQKRERSGRAEAQQLLPTLPSLACFVGGS